MGRFITVVLDGCGIGQTPDVASGRPADVGSNTFGHLLALYPGMHIPNLVEMGMLGALHYEQAPALQACYSRIRFAHYGADTFYGHQEIMGTEPALPRLHPMRDSFEQVRAALEEAGLRVRTDGTDRPLLVVEEAMSVGDNIESDPGNAINVNASLDLADFELVQRVGRAVRAVVSVPRVIAFGGSGVSLEDILAAKEVKGEYVGVSAPRSGVYRENYHCVHMGYGVDPARQAPRLLHGCGVPTLLVGKVADIVENPGGETVSLVPTRECMDRTVELMGRYERGFFCTNIQETDLAGHAEDPARYREVLEEADRGLGRIRAAMGQEDILTVIADHGNDATIGHTRHTREYVPLLADGARVHKAGRFAEQPTLACIGASACDYFGCAYDLYGESFLPALYGA